MNEDKEPSIFTHFDANQIETFKIIDKQYSPHVEGVHFATGKTLHFWGQFTSELPERFQPDGKGGHQYISCTSLEEAEKTCQELRTFIFQQWSDAVEWAGNGWYRWMIHDMRQMTLEFQN